MTPPRPPLASPPAPGPAATPAPAPAPGAGPVAAPAGPDTHRGRLLLVPNTLDLGCDPPAPLEAALPHQVIEQAAALGHWVVENAKTTRALLKRIDARVPLRLPLQAIQIQELPRAPKGGAGKPAREAPRAGARDTAAPARPPQDPLAALLQPALDGHDIGLLSEAGLPGVADPGAALVQAAHDAGLTVVPLAGPSALLLALAASGCNGQHFAFIGYLPVDAAERAARVRTLEQWSREHQQTQLAIETPYRNATLLAALVATLAPSTRLSVSSGLTLAEGQTHSMSVARWRRLPALPALPQPAVFAWLGQAG